MEGADDTAEDDPSDGIASPVGSGDWDELRWQVFDAAMGREFGAPDDPLVKIGRFDGLRWIGEGGYGVVFKAIDPELDRLVALKLCRRRSIRLNAAIKAEARALAKLEHPNIVQVFEPGEHAGWAFFAMQYIEGGNAHEFGGREPRPSWREVVDVYRRVARALAFAHEQGLTHGDIKPANILIDRRGFPFLADFGLAQIVVRNAPESEREGLRRLAGTLVYMAPEVLDGEIGGARSDQFSLCVSILHTLLGTAPFSGDTSGQVLADIAESLDETLELVELVPLREVLRKGLAMDPLERFASVDELADALDRLVAPVHSMPSPEFEPEPPHEGEPKSADGSASTEPESDAASASVGRLEPSDEEVVLLRVGPDTTPTSEPKRRSFASFVLIGLVCVTIGWMGRGRVEGPRTSDPSSSTRELERPVPVHRGWANGLTSYSHALQAIDRGDLGAGYDAWVSGHFDVSRSTPGLDGELSLLLAKRVGGPNLGSADAHALASWMANGAAESFEQAQSWRRAAEAREVAAELARAANREGQAAYQERCVLVNAMGRPC